MPDVSVSAGDYKVKDISLAGWGRKEIEMAQDEMPGLAIMSKRANGCEAETCLPNMAIAPTARVRAPTERMARSERGMIAPPVLGDLFLLLVGRLCWWYGPAGRRRCSDA